MIRALPLLLVAGLFTAGCTMPEVPPGFQLDCYDNNGGGGGGDNKCPDDARCQDGCCVRQGEEPVCANRHRAVTGDPCTPQACDPHGGCNGQPVCGADATCFTEADTGAANGLCSRDCSAGGCPTTAVCRALTNLKSGAAKLCLARCNPEECRRGFRCDCDTNPCACVPDCRGVGGCGKGTHCNADTGLCDACAAVGTACTSDGACCSGSCCSGKCADGACP